MDKSNKINKWIDEYGKNRISEETLLTNVISEFNEKDLPYLFSSLFTKDEIKTFAHRLLIIKKLKEDNISQSDIAHQLKVGVATVTRGSKEIEKGRFKFI